MNRLSPLMRADSALIFGLRCRLGLTQTQFADTFGLSVGSVQNTEQARFLASPLMRLALVAIELDPAFMKRAAAAAQQRVDDHIAELMETAG